MKGINLRERNPRWNGGEFIANGYVFILKPEHANSRKNGYIKRCRYVMSEHLNRPLDVNELVHHINGDKLDDRLDNLVVISRKAHTSIHAVGANNGNYCTDFRTKVCPNCGKEIVRTNGNNFVRNVCCSAQCRAEYYVKERGGNTKITQDIADKIRSLKGILTHSKIATAFGISRSHVSRILRGDFWG